MSSSTNDPLSETLGIMKSYIETIDEKDKIIQKLKSSHPTNQSQKSVDQPHYSYYQTNPYQQMQMYNYQKTVSFQYDVINCFRIPQDVMSRKLIKNRHYISIKNIQKCLYLKYKTTFKWLKEYFRSNGMFKVVQRKGITYVCYIQSNDPT